MTIPVSVSGSPLPATDAEVASAESLLASIVRVIARGSNGATTDNTSPTYAQDPTGTLGLVPLQLATAQQQLFLRQLSVALATWLPSATIPGEATTVDIDSIVTTGLGDGDFAFVNGAGEAVKTDSSSLASSCCIGANTGTAGKIRIIGPIDNAKFTDVGGEPLIGKPVYLAAFLDDGSTGSGKLTATPPVTGVLAEIGVCLDNSNYAASKICKVLLQIKDPIEL